MAPPPVLRAAVVAAALAASWVGPAAAETPPWSSRAAIPSACLPQVKVPEYGRCLFDDQCETTFCCPYFRTCLGPDGLQYNPVNDMGDTLRVALVWGQGGNQAYSRVNHHTSQYGAADICNRDNAQSQEFGRCGPVSDGVTTGPRLQDSSIVKAFDLSNAECECDQRFIDLYQAGDWTGTYVNGVFKNYCEPDYLTAEAGAAQCPSGYVRIVSLSGCQTAIVELGLADATDYMNSHFGANAFPGCVRNVGSDGNGASVAYNKDNSDTLSDFALASNEAYVCKKDGIQHSSEGGSSSSDSPSTSGQPTASSSSSSSTSGPCTDCDSSDDCKDLEGWQDSLGATCADYSQGWCTPGGDAGANWAYRDFPLDAFADRDGHWAGTACCVCGGGGGTPSPDSEKTESEKEDYIELKFRDLSFADTDHEDFKTELLGGLEKMGCSAVSCNQLQIVLRSGSIIAKITGPPTAMAEVRSKPLDTLVVMGCTAVVMTESGPDSDAPADGQCIKVKRELLDKWPGLRLKPCAA